MIKARLPKGFRGHLTPLVNLLFNGIDALQKERIEEFEFMVGSMTGEQLFSVTASKDSSSNPIFLIDETEFLRSTVTIRQASNLRILGWRTPPDGSKVSYLYSSKGSMDRNFLAGVILDALTEVLGDLRKSCFKIRIGNKIWEEIEMQGFENCREAGFRLR